MKSINIKIEKERVIDDMHRETALLALKNNNNSVIAYSEDDTERIEPFWIYSLDELLQLLLPFAKMSLNDDNAVFLLSLPENWDDTQIETLQQLSQNFVVNSLIARWMDYVKSDLAMLLRSLNNTTVMAINEILYKRKKVQRL